MSYPTRIRVNLQRNAKAGLFAAVSDDLPGLMTVGHTIEEIEQRLPAAIAQLIKAQYGEDVEFQCADSEPSDDFLSLSDPRVIELRAA